MNRVEDLIIQALTTADNNSLRQKAENTIFSLLRENPTDFFTTCTNIVTESAKNLNLRQQAATVMKAVLAKRAENNEYYWDLVDSNMREVIKDLLLSSLLSDNLIVMRASANVIAQIAAIEIARNSWLDIVPKLAQNSSHSKINVRRASVTTLGFICEQLKHVPSSINPQVCNSILISILTGLNEQQDKSLVDISLTALRESIRFLRPILENPQYCTKVFEFVLPYSNSEYTQKVYEALFEFGKYCYHLLGPYLPALLSLTLDHIHQRNELSILALELWDTVGTEYIKRAQNEAHRVGGQGGGLRNFLEEMQEVLLPQIMQAILILDKVDLALPDLREVAVKTLGTYVNCCGLNVADKVTEGVSRVLGSPNAGERQASALIFSSLCFYEDRSYVERCFITGFPHLLQLITDQELIVRKNTLNGFTTLSENFPEVFLKYNDIFNFFLHLLNLSTKEDEDIQILSLSILINITDSLKDHPECRLATEPETILQKMVAIFTSNLTQSLFKESNEKIIIVIMNVLYATSKKGVLVMLVSHLIDLYKNSANSKINDREIVLAQIITVIHTCLLSLSKFAMQLEMKHKLYELIDLHLSINGVEQEGIYMISGLAIAFKRDFLSEHFDKYWGVVLQGLECFDQKPTFKAALNCIADIARCDDSNIMGHLSPVFGKLVHIMHNCNDRELKIEILNCFGDLSIGLKSHGEVFMNTLIQICNDCFDAVYKFEEADQEREYAEELKESLMDMYHCVVFAQNEHMRINRQLADHFPIVSTFIVRTCQVRLKPTIEYLKMCLYVIFDSALFYAKGEFSEMAKNIVTSPEVQGLVSIIRKFDSRRDVQDLLKFIEEKIITKGK